MSTPRRVLVTGGSGLLGRYVIDALLDAGHEPRVLDIKPPMKSVEYEECDILDLAGVCRAVVGSDAVIHLAGIDAGNDFPDKDYFETNVQGAWNVLHACEQSGTRDIVVASSAATYGFGFDRAPMYLPVDEAHPLRPRDTYGLTKQVIETVCRHFVASSEMNIICLRPTLVVRPEREQAILVQLSLANPDEDARQDIISTDSVEPYGGLSATRSYVRSEDCAQCFRLALENIGSGFETINVAATDGMGRPRTLQRYQQLFGHDPTVRKPFVYEADACAAVLDTSRARTRLGWCATGSWDDVVTAQDAPEH